MALQKNEIGAILVLLFIIIEVFLKVNIVD